MNYDPRQPPPPQIIQANPAFDAWVETRAIELCTDGLHTTDVARPCWTHLREARREGLAAWRAKGGRIT